MKANVKTSNGNKIVVRGVSLDFNCMNENHLRRLRDIGSELEKEHPGAMDLELTDMQDLDGIIARRAEGTHVFCELFDRMFGEGTSKKVFGEDPYFGLCVDVYYGEFLPEIARQCARGGQKIEKYLEKYIPAGPKGSAK